jgi:hypothetical protein
MNEKKANPLEIMWEINVSNRDQGTFIEVIKLAVTMQRWRDSGGDVDLS